MIAGAERLAVAALVGAAVGIEREWSGHASGPHARFAGARTFFLLGLTGGVAGTLAGGPLLPLAVALLAGGAALSVAGYLAAARRRGDGEAVDGTTEAAALAVLALGTLAGTGEEALASGAAAVVVLALSEKARLHRAVRAIDADELRGALQFAVLALVVLPLLPDGSYGPLGGIRPRGLWIVVLLFSGLNFAGYLARRAVGAERGYGVAGMLGGLISSTAVTLHFSRLSRREPEMARPLASGVVGACTVLLPRIAVLTAILNPAVTVALAPYLAPPLLAGGAMVAWSLLRPGPAAAAAPPQPRSPLNLWTAIQMAVAFQLVLYAVAFVRQTWGSPGVLASAAALGLTDMDALTLSMSRLGPTAAAAALGARAIAIGILANTALKLAVTLALGSPSFRRTAGAGLALMAAAVGAGLWLGARVTLAPP
ncbi:MAG TPA: DUF4010 domain-containing protein [Longimicrobium sp.]